MSEPTRPTALASLGRGRTDLMNRTRYLIGILFSLAAAVSVLASFLPGPDAHVNLPLLLAAAVLALAMSAWYLTAPFARYHAKPRMWLSLAASLVVAVAVYATGGAHSYLQPMFLMVVVYAAAFTGPRQILGVAAVVAMAAALPLIYGYDPWYVRSWLVQATVYFAAAFFSSTVVSIVVREQRERTQLVELALEEASRISLSLDLSKTLEVIVAQLKAVTGADSCVVYLVDPAGGVLVPKVISLDASYPRSDAEAIAAGHAVRGQGLVGWVWEHQEPLLLGDAERDPRAVHVPGTAVEDASYLLVPLVVEDRVLGVIRLSRQGLYQFHNQDLRLATIFANQSAVAIENARLYEEAERLSITDGLTGLYNARYLEARLAEEVARSQRYGHSLALLMMDLDTLKAVNDRFGHLEGNRLLRIFASILTDTVRRSDLVIRYAGDEFVVVMPETELEDARIVAERICQTLASTPFIAGRDRVNVTVSIGVSAGRGRDVEGEPLIRRADAALYLAKRSGKNQVQVAPPDSL